MSFDDIIRIKQVEDVLEKYWNDHRMDATVEYLVTKVFPTPFDFFQEFGSYWEQKGWSRIGHQLEDLFKRLFEFLQTKEIADLDIAEGLMKFDYISKQKYKPRKPWWQPSLEKSERSKLYQSLLENPNQLGESFLNLQLNEKEIYKHTLSERLSFDIERYINEGLIEKKDSVLLAYFDSSSEEVSIFSGPLQ